MAASTNGVNTFDDSAAATSPLSRWCVALVWPHPGHHSPVVAWKPHAGNRLPGADGSFNATTAAAPASAAPVASDATCIRRDDTARRSTVG